MSPDQIAWARAVAEESYDGQLIRDLCNALEDATEDVKLALKRAWDSGHDASREGVQRFRNPYRAEVPSI